jgi:hypothetical protein
MRSRECLSRAPQPLLAFKSAVKVSKFEDICIPRFWAGQEETNGWLGSTGTQTGANILDCLFNCGRDVTGE